MRGLQQVIRRLRPSPTPPAGETAPPAAVAIPPTAEASGTEGTSETPIATEQTPAGVDPSAQPRPSFASRGRLRRRLRYLRRVRELGLRDLGGLVFDQHRFGQLKPELVEGKLAALSAVDAELRVLERALDQPRTVTELREPGISACPRCGALHGSDARFCPSCGVPLRGPRAMAGIGEGVSEGVGEIGPLSLPGAPPTRAQAEPQAAGAEPRGAEAEPPAQVEPQPTQAEPQPTQAEPDPAEPQPTVAMPALPDLGPDDTDTPRPPDDGGEQTAAITPERSQP